MPLSRLEYLFTGYCNRALTDDELQELMLLLRQPANEAAVKALLDGVWNNLSIDNQLSAAKADALFSAILASDPGTRTSIIQRPVRRLFTATRIAAAAVLLLCMSAGVWYFFFKKPAPPTVQTNEPAHITNDIPPGRNSAVLVLADGSRINLDSAGN
ncbi:MAG TPA: hypothetical protein VF008_30660, partial [Niastella sp.]